MFKITSNQKAFFFQFLFLNPLVFFACERNVVSLEAGRVTIQIPHSNRVEKAISDVTIFSSGAPPLSWNDVDCYGFLISGPEESMRSSQCEKLNGLTGFLDGQILFGKIYGGFYKTDSIELEVPSGSGRVITTLAFKSNIPLATPSAAACRSLLRQENDLFSKPFVYAKSASFNVEPGSTQTIVMPIDYTYNSSPFVGDCKGPSAPGHGADTLESGPPAKMRMRVQSNLMSLTEDSCVAVIFELLDANGNKPEVSENFAFRVTESTNRAEFFTIDGTYCTSATGPSTQSLLFYDTSNRYSSVVRFMKIAANGSFNFLITQSMGTSLPVETPVNLPVYSRGIPSTDGPFKISIFDIYSFKSTAESLASNPIKVKANECRPAVVQIS